MFSYSDGAGSSRRRRHHRVCCCFRFLEPGADSSGTSEETKHAPFATSVKLQLMRFYLGVIHYT